MRVHGITLEGKESNTRDFFHRILFQSHLFTKLNLSTTRVFTFERMGYEKDVYYCNKKVYIKFWNNWLCMENKMRLCSMS